MEEKKERRQNAKAQRRGEEGPAEGKHLSPEESGEQKKKPHRALRAFGAFLLKLMVLCALGWALLNYVIWVGLCHTNDMYPALRDGDLVITYRLQPFLYGNIVSYEHEGQRYLSRIVGLPGDEVEIDPEGHYSINGNVPYETVYYETRSPEDSPVEYPYTVREGELFVLNDMRDNMKDSREFGAIREEDVDGSVALLLRRRGW